MGAYKSFTKSFGCKKLISKKDYYLLHELADHLPLTKGDKLIISAILDPIVENRFDKEWAACEEHTDQNGQMLIPAGFNWWSYREHVRAKARESVLGHFGLKF